jgi:hypothetical protein
MTREEPSLETLWLKHIRTMDKVKITDPRISTVLSYISFLFSELRRLLLEAKRLWHEHNYSSAYNAETYAFCAWFIGVRADN